MQLGATWAIAMLGSAFAGDGLLHAKKSTYVIAGSATGNAATWPKRFNPTFETYLNKEVGSKFSPQIRFVLQPVDSVSIFTAVES